MLPAQAAASERTHYDELGIARSATADEVRRAYRRLALQSHPDKCSEADAADRFIRVNKAWETLSTASSRRAYDIELEVRKAQLQQLQHPQANRNVVYAGFAPIAKLLNLIKDTGGRVKIAELRLESERCGVEFPTDSLEREDLLKQLFESAQGKLDHRIKSQDWNRLAREDLVAWLELHGCSLQYALACDTVDKDRLILLVRSLLQKGTNESQQECPIFRTRSSSGCNDSVRGGVAGVSTPARSPSKPPSTPKAKAKSRIFQATRAKTDKVPKAKMSPLFAFTAPVRTGSRRQRQPARSLSQPWGVPGTTPTPAPKPAPKAKSQTKAFKVEEAQERQNAKAGKPRKRISPKAVSTPPQRSTRESSSDSSSATESPSSTSSSSSSPSPAPAPKRPRKQAVQKPEGELNQRIEELRADLQAVRSAARSDHPKALPTLVELVKLENEQRIDAVRQRRLLGELNKAWWRREVHGSVAWHASSLVLRWTARREAAAKSRAE